MLIVKRDSKSVAAEAFRTLRTNIQYSSIDKEIRTIMCTSAGPAEGKSSTIGNLALTLAGTDKKVLIIDCDMRKPSIHKKFRLSNATGLSDYLTGEVDLVDAIHKVESKLDIITSGPVPPNPAEMLSSKKMKDFMEDLKQQYDYILLDTPPVIAVTDAQVLASEVDGVVLVVASKEADKDAVVRAKELLNKVNANILGVVLNKTELRSGKGYGYSYQYYYYYGENEKHKKNKKGIFKKKNAS
ncbi:CpsD/CapB family tyrosine-protein kinase [Clostridium sediminicola]|uniref:CpsD/CapB family tyrosine-protein kinase n=1 Tax=Clostridium sediminicola TaxID=3114879 RepID=UPI0031F21746